MFKSMSLESRRELLVNVREQYKKGAPIKQGNTLMRMVGERKDTRWVYCCQWI
jgi:hypothetical protein